MVSQASAAGAEDMKKAKTGRFGKEDWLQLGLAQLAAGGPRALRSTELVDAAGKTIGSFYHHFADQNDFFDALVAHWRDTNTVPIMTAVDPIADADQQADRLTDLATRLDERVETGIRLFAHENGTAASAVAAVDALRIGYVAQIYQRRFSISAEEAERLAQLEYAAFVGAQMVFHQHYRALAPSLARLFQEMVGRTNHAEKSDTAA